MALGVALAFGLRWASVMGEVRAALVGTIEKPAPPYAYALWLRAQLGEKLGESPEKRCQRVEEAVRVYEDAGARYWTEQAKKWLEKLGQRGFEG